MFNNKVKYIGFYDFPKSKSKRVSNLAAVNKMNYVASAINRTGYHVEIISPSWMSEESEISFEMKKKESLTHGTDIIFGPSWKTKKKMARNIKISFSLLWLFFYLITNTKENEKIIVYHVPWVSIPLRAAKFFKKFHIILEVEEIYGEVWKESKKFSKMEQKLIEAANSFIFVSDILEKKVNIKKNPYLVLYGSYQIIPHLERERLCNDPIKLLYAGSIDSTKGGAFNAVNSLRFLPGNYKLYIIGHGSKKSVAELRETIKNINNEKGFEACVFDGTLHGQKYTDYLLDCDIALNPQNQGDYMQTAFPSKIISYLSHNLQIISTNIESVKNSEIASYIYFLRDDSPKSIAEAIRAQRVKATYDSKALIMELDKKFVNDIKSLLSEEDV